MHGATAMKKVHDRRSVDLLAAGQYATMEVDDPYEEGEKVSVERQTRGDPLGRLHSHHQIDDAQYHAGRAYQADRERADRGARAIDPTKEAVDGGKLPEPLTDSQINARKRLVEVEEMLGRRLHGVVEAVLIQGQTMEELSGSNAQQVLRYHGRLFRDALNELAVFYGLATNTVCRYSKSPVSR